MAAEGQALIERATKEDFDALKAKNEQLIASERVYDLEDSLEKLLPSGAQNQQIIT